MKLHGFISHLWYWWACRYHLNPISYSLKTHPIRHFFAMHIPETSIKHMTLQPLQDMSVEQKNMAPRSSQSQIVPDHPGARWPFLRLHRSPRPAGTTSAGLPFGGLAQRGADAQGFQGAWGGPGSRRVVGENGWTQKTLLGSTWLKYENMKVQPWTEKPSGGISQVEDLTSLLHPAEANCSGAEEVLLILHCAESWPAEKLGGEVVGVSGGKSLWSWEKHGV